MRTSLQGILHFLNTLIAIFNGQLSFGNLSSLSCDYLPVRGIPFLPFLGLLLVLIEHLFQELKYLGPSTYAYKISLFYPQNRYGWLYIKVYISNNFPLLAPGLQSIKSMPKYLDFWTSICHVFHSPLVWNILKFSLSQYSEIL